MLTCVYMGMYELGPQLATSAVGALFLSTGGRYGGGFQFNGNSSVTVPKDPCPQNTPATTGFSIAIWLFVNNLGNARIWERMYDNMDLNMNPNGGVWCRMHFTLGNYLDTSSYIIATSVWNHAGCCFNASTGVLQLFVNGLQRANITWTGAPIVGFQHSSFINFGLGNRPSSVSAPNQGFIGILDEVTIWARPLSAVEWACVAALSSTLLPFTGVGFSSINFVNITSFTQISFQGSASFSFTDTAASVVVSISTDAGLSFCTLLYNQNFSMLSQGNNPVCLFPAVSLIYRVQYLKQVSLASLSFLFSSADDVWPSVTPIGLNIAGPSYYSNEVLRRYLF